MCGPASAPSGTGEVGGREVVLPVSWMVLLGLLGADTDGRLVAHLALARAHGGGRVALERFYVVEAFVYSRAQVVERNVLTGANKNLLRVRLGTLGEACGRRQQFAGHRPYCRNTIRQPTRDKYGPFLIPFNVAAGLCD